LTTKKPITMVAGVRCDIRDIATIVKYLKGNGSIKETISGLVREAIGEYAAMVKDDYPALSFELTNGAAKYLEELGLTSNVKVLPRNKKRQVKLERVELEKQLAEEENEAIDLVVADLLRGELIDEAGIQIPDDLGLSSSDGVNDRTGDIG